MSASAVSPGVQAPPVKYVVFRLGGAVRLALPQMAVREGLDMASVVVAPMPGAAAIFQGIANVRGSFLWVLDLVRLLKPYKRLLRLCPSKSLTGHLDPRRNFTPYRRPELLCCCCCWWP